MTHAASDLHVAGLPVMRASVGGVLDRVWSEIGHDSPSVYVSVNANSASLRRNHAGYAEALARPRSLCVADGVSLTLGARALGYGRIGRVTGVDLLDSACRRAATDGTGFFLLGGDPGVAERLRDSLKAANPGLRIAGVATPAYGKWPAEETERLVRTVRDSGADVLWIGVAAGKQEVWALRQLDELRMPVLCVGAAFDFLSGTKPRAPRWVRRAGLEWLFRFASEPRRLWRRYTIGNAIYLLDLLRYGRKPADRRR